MCNLARKLLLGHVNSNLAMVQWAIFNSILHVCVCTIRSDLRSSLILSYLNYFLNPLLKNVCVAA